MDTPIIFTPNQFLAAILAICGAIVSISAAAAAIGKLAAKAKKPNEDQNKRLDTHEEWLKKHDEKFKTYDGYFDRDKKRLDSIEEGNRVTQKALLALLSHALNGNDITSLADAKEALEKYLVNR